MRSKSIRYSLEAGVDKPTCGATASVEARLPVDQCGGGVEVTADENGASAGRCGVGEGCVGAPGRQNRRQPPALGVVVELFNEARAYELTVHSVYGVPPAGWCGAWGRCYL